MLLDWRGRSLKRKMFVHPSPLDKNLRLAMSFLIPPSFNTIGGIKKEVLSFSGFLALTFVF